MHPFSKHPVLRGIVVSILGALGSKLLLNIVSDPTAEIEIQIFLEDASAAASVEASLRELLEELGVEKIHEAQAVRL